MAAPSIYVPSQSSKCLLPLLKRSAIVSDLDLFQITVFVLGLGTCEILQLPFKSEVSVSCAPIALLYASSVGLQNQMFGGSPSQYRTSRLEIPVLVLAAPGGPLPF